MSVAVVAVVLTALLFDFTNGFHDTANAMATSIATGALRPRAAVLLAGLMNLAGAFVSVKVAATIAGGLVDDAQITPEVVFGGLVGAILWNLLTWLLGLPSSSSHALFGGLIGATWAAAGPDAVDPSLLAGKVLLPLALSPILAGVAALLLTLLTDRVVARGDGRRTTRAFLRLQTVSASTVAFAHGTNDAQKTMGVITLTLVTAGLLPAHAAPPTWVILAAGLAIATGTAVGGWRVIRTVGARITTITSQQGFAAETGSAAIILGASHLGLPLSTTQVTSGAVLGSAAARPHTVVQWATAVRMATVWVLTLPAAAALGAAAAAVTSHGTRGTLVVAGLATVAAGFLYALSRLRPVTAATVTPAPAPAPLPGVRSSGDRTAA